MRRAPGSKKRGGASKAFKEQMNQRILENVHSPSHAATLSFPRQKDDKVLERPFHAFAMSRGVDVGVLFTFNLFCNLFLVSLVAHAPEEVEKWFLGLIEGKMEGCEGEWRVFQKRRDRFFDVQLAGISIADVSKEQVLELCVRRMSGHFDWKQINMRLQISRGRDDKPGRFFFNCECRKEMLLVRDLLEGAKIGARTVFAAFRPDAMDLPAKKASAGGPDNNKAEREQVNVQAQELMIQVADLTAVVQKLTLAMANLQPAVPEPSSRLRPPSKESLQHLEPEQHFLTQSIWGDSGEETSPVTPRVDQKRSGDLGETGLTPPKKKSPVGIDESAVGRNEENTENFLLSSHLQ